MSFNIIHGDIAQSNTDAVVLPANPQLLEGPGASHAVFEAAGLKELKAACKEIGYCPLGSAVITPGFGLQAKNIIHAVCPAYIDGTHKEAELLYSAYKTSLQLAVDNGLTSISFPLLSAGNYRFPRGEALDIANRAIMDFLEEHDDFEVQLVIYDREVLRDQNCYSGDIDSLLARRMERRFESRTENRFERRTERRFESRSVRPPRGAVGSAVLLEEEDFEELANQIDFEDSAIPASPTLKSKKSLDDIIKIKQQSFCDLLNDFIIRSEMTNPQIYRKAMISKQVFSKAISGQDKPKKNTILALAIALELDIEDTEKLLMKAGYAFSDTSVTDIVVRYFIERANYDIMAINETLFCYEQPLLGNAIA